MQLKCGWILNNRVTANSPQSVPVKEFLKLVNIWQRYKQKFGGMFFSLTVYSTEHKPSHQQTSFTLTYSNICNIPPFVAYFLICNYTFTKKYCNHFINTIQYSIDFHYTEYTKNTNTSKQCPGRRLSDTLSSHYNTCQIFYT